MKTTNSKSEDKFIKVSNSVASRTDLPPLAKMVFSRLVRLAEKTGKAYPKHQTLADEFGVSRRSIVRVTRLLQDEGLITCVRGQAHNWYYITVEQKATPTLPVGESVDETSCPTRCDMMSYQIRQVVLPDAT
jgi:DNA-binding IscR family transcriptional regulator